MLTEFRKHPYVEFLKSFYLFQGSTKPPACATKSSVVTQISLLHSVNRCLRNPSSAFSSEYLWSEADTTLLFLHSLTFKSISASECLPPPHQDGLWEHSAVCVQQTLVHPEGHSCSLSLQLSQPGEIKDFTGLWSVCQNT